MSDEEKLHRLVEGFIELQDDHNRLAQAFPAIVEEWKKESYAQFLTWFEKQSATTKDALLDNTKQLTAASEKELLGLIQTTLARVKQEFAGKLEEITSHFAAANEAVAGLRVELKATREDVSQRFALAEKQFADVVNAATEKTRLEFAAKPAEDTGSSFANSFKGNWSKDLLLKRGDTFTFRGSTYLTLRDSVGILPTQQEQKGSNPRYAVIAACGSPGPKGLDAVGVSINTAPATATSNGVTGTFAYGGGYLYICTSTNVWRRIATSSF